MAKKQKRSTKKQKPEESNLPPVTNSIESKNNFWKDQLIPMALLFLLPFALYISSLDFEYVLDDKIVITENDYVKKGFAGIFDIFDKDSFQGYFGEQKKVLEGGRYRPLSLATFAIEYHFFGLNPKLGHLFNILLYALSGLLLFRVMTILIPPLKNNRWFLSFPFVVTLLFILHPIHTEVVANIKGRDEILALLFSLGALYFALKNARKQNILWLCGMCISLLLAILAKENALTWLLIIPMSLYFFTKTKPRVYLETGIGILVMIGIYFAIRYNAIGYFLNSGEESKDIMNNPFHGLHIGERAATIMSTLGIYIKLLLYPHPLTHDYYPYQIPIIGFDNWKAILSLAVNLGLGIYALFGIRKKSIVSYGILFYFITLSIVSNVFVNVGTTMNERFVYMPSVGLCIILAYFIARWLPAKLNEKADDINVLSAGLLLILILGYATKTLMRVPDWRNALTLNSAAVKYSPNSARANCFMGVAIFEDYKIESDPTKRAAMLDEATIYLDRSLELYPAYGSALTMKSGILAEHYKKDFDIDKLLDGFTTILRYKETTAFTNEYIEYLIKQNRSPDKVKPFLYNIGMGINFKGRKSYAAAIHYLNYALQIDPNDQNVLQGLAQCYQALGNQSKANEFLQRIN